MMTEDEFRWAEALAIYRMHGDQAASWLADRLANLARAGDVAGVERLGRIAVRIEQLVTGEGGTRH